MTSTLRFSIRFLWAALAIFCAVLIVTVLTVGVAG